MHKSILSVIMLICTLNVFAQNDDLRDIYLEAESHYLFGEYELANPLYLILDDYMADNANIKFKIGNCFLHIPDEKTKAIPYLEEAVENASYYANPGSFRETRAPLEAYFALASAYRINYEFEKAMETYARLKELMSDREMLENADFIDQQMSACRTAMTFLEKPVEFNKQNLGPGINLGSVNINPAVSGNGNTLVYTEKRGLENTIYFIRKNGGEWGEPVDITAQLGGETDCASNSLNIDGTELYLYKNDDFDGNIYMSSFENGKWSEIKKLNRNINTRFYESHACVSPDGSKLYFTSNRDGGEGGLDIYVAEKNSRGEWGEAKNIGPVINTPFNEDTPFITMNGSALYFSSEGHVNMGGYDIFSSRQVGGVWSSPSNEGYPLNTPDDDLFLNPVNNGQNAYYSMVKGYKEKDLFYLELDKKQSLPTFEIKGTLSLRDTTIEFNDDYRIILYSITEEDTIDIGYPNKSTGLYSFIVKPDEYLLTYEGLAYLSVTEKVTILHDHPSKEEIINITLEPDPDYVAEKVRKIDFTKVQVIDAIDSSILVTDVIVRDVSDSDSSNTEVLYYTVQLMALYNPVDVSFFEYADVTVVYNEDDKFYRYTTGRFDAKEEAYRRRDELIRLGYPDDLWVKTVIRRSNQ
ncbi:MAG: PD40 domain-containing protein [Bacteroidales bacterium]|nr:PD40 domain-containing protein [Bacteroidales bacterium]